MRKVIGIILLVLVVLIGGAIALIYFNVFSLGNTVANIVGYDAPVISMILPEKPEEEQGNPYDFETVEEAVETLKFTEKMLKESKESADKLGEEVEKLTLEIDRLKKFENNQVQFEKDKAEFDAYIATSFNAKDYLLWFEKMYPKNADEMYSQIGKENQKNETNKAVAAMYEEMKAAEAAKVLEEMVKYNIDEVVDILKHLSKKQAGSILGNMEPSTASKITTYMYGQ